jgi:thiol-disulfide isomerase/thioredoxin
MIINLIHLYYFFIYLLYRMKDGIVVLYYANWCGHCQTFKQSWNKFKEVARTHNIGCVSKEESQLKTTPQIGGNPIKGYPTIGIYKKVGSKYEGIEYEGNRTSEDLLKFTLKYIGKKD